MIILYMAAGWVIVCIAIAYIVAFIHAVFAPAHTAPDAPESRSRDGAKGGTKDRR